MSGADTLVSPVQNGLDEQIGVAAASAFYTPVSIQSTNVVVDGQQFPFTTTPPLPPATQLATTAAGLATLGIGGLDPRYPVRTSPLPPEIRTPAGQYGLRPARRQIPRNVARFGGPLTTIQPTPTSTATFDAAQYRWLNVPIVATTLTALGGVEGEFKYSTIDSIEPPPSEGGLTAAEIDGIMARGIDEMNATSAAIRLPRGISVRNHIVVVDVRGNILSAFRMGDGTLFSFDVAVQKARTSAFFSTDTFAASCRGIGFMAQPFFPPGIDGTEPGPLARIRDVINRGKIPEEFPPSFNLLNPPPRPPSDGTTDENVLVAGRQLFNDLGTGPLAASQTAAVATIRGRVGASGGICTLADTGAFVSPGIQSGIQTFAGGVPLYKNGRLVGGIGASGDGIDEDDLMVYTAAFGFDPPTGTRIDEVGESVIATTIIAKLNQLAAAMNAHPDAAMRAVYGPIFTREAALAADRFSRGLDGVRIPYVKLPRSPGER